MMGAWRLFCGDGGGVNEEGACWWKVGRTSRQVEICARDRKVIRCDRVVICISRMF